MPLLPFNIMSKASGSNSRVIDIIYGSSIDMEHPTQEQEEKNFTRTARKENYLQSLSSFKIELHAPRAAIQNVTTLSKLVAIMYVLAPFKTCLLKQG